jgi:transcriptional regulator
MYVPGYAQLDDTQLIQGFIREHPFATVISSGSELFANHFPFLLETDENGAKAKLTSHMAKRNGQWEQFLRDPRALVIFQGAHAYISPSIYVNAQNVPTWNYMAVHVYGVTKVIQDSESIEKILHLMVEHFEGRQGNPWKYDLPTEFRQSLISAIVGFEIEVERIEANFKLSQNRAREDYAAVIKEFSTRPDENSKELLKYMNLTGTLMNPLIFI